MIELTLEQGRAILSALRIGEISFERDEGIRLWVGDREIQDISHLKEPEMSMMISIVKAVKLIEDKVAEESDRVYADPNYGKTTDRFEILDIE